MKPTKRQTTPTLRESLETVDWDKLAEMEPDPAQLEQQSNLPSARPSETVTALPGEQTGSSMKDQLISMGAKPEFLLALMNMATLEDPQWAKDNYPEMFKE